MSVEQYLLLDVLLLPPQKLTETHRGGQLPMETRYTCAPRVIGKIKKTLPWL